MTCLSNLGNCSLKDFLNVTMFSYSAAAKRLCTPGPGAQASHQENSSTATTNMQDTRDSLQPGPTRSAELPDQDLPLSFDHSRLAIAVAGSRGASSGQHSETNTLAHVLRNSLPNLHSSALAQVPETPERNLAKPSPCTEQNEAKTEHVLGLGCYSSSSDEET